MDIEACVTPTENFLHKGKADQLFWEQQGEDLVGEKIADGAIGSCTSFGHQNMDMNISQVVAVDKSDLQGKIGSLSPERIGEIVEGIKLLVEPLPDPRPKSAFLGEKAEAGPVRRFFCESAFVAPRKP